MTSNKLTDLRKALRFEYLSFTLALPVLGAASVAPSISLQQTAMLLAAAFLFHVHAGFVNDLIDLPLDRANPNRAAHPMARGSLKRGHALWLALAAFALAFAVTGMQGAPAQGTLMASFALMAVYNLWGKKTPVPPVMDGILSASFAFLVLFGALSTGGTEPLTFLVCVLVALFMMLANAFGGLRDLASDLPHGAVTTAIFFGARPLKNGLHIPRPLIRYVGLLVLVFYGTVAFGLLGGLFAYPAVTAGLLLATVAVCAGATSVALVALSRVAARDARLMMAHGYFILSAAAGAALAAVVPRVSPWLAAGIVLLFLFSFACWRPARLYGYWREVLR